MATGDPAILEQTEVGRLRKEVHDLIWNLGGISTLALGYCLDEPFSKDLARPALYDTHTLALKHRALRQGIEAALNELGIPQPGYPAPVSNAVKLLQDALAYRP